MSSVFTGKRLTAKMSLCRQQSIYKDRSEYYLVFPAYTLRLFTLLIIMYQDQEAGSALFAVNSS